MNERIKLLKEQSMEWVPNMADPDTKIRLLNAGKFAELIVKECAALVKGQPHVDKMMDCNSVIKQYFGVEE
jgi:hypothetical protein